MPDSNDAPPGAASSLQARVTRLVGRPAFWAAFVAVAVSWPIARALVLASRLPPPPVMGTVPEFELVDQHGHAFGSRQLRGRVWVAGFMFTRCPTVCPRLTETMRDVQRRARNLGGSFHLVSFTVDPEHDTPAVLDEYARKWLVRSHAWSFLTGPLEVLKPTIVEGLKVAMQEAGSDGDPTGILHGTHFVLVDADLHVRGYYESSDPAAVDRLLRDAGLLANRGG